MVQIHCYLQTP